MPARRFRRFNALLGAFTLILAGMVTIANLVIDPYGVWRVVSVKGVSAAKSERRDQNYLFKATDALRRDEAALMIGSSRVAFGLDPEHRAFADNGGGYNLGLTGGHLYAVQRYLEHAIRNNPGIRTVVLGLDFFAFSAKVRLPDAYEDDRLDGSSVTWADTAATLLSLDATWASLLTVISNRRDPTYQPYFDNGLLTGIDMGRQVEERGMVQRFERSLNLYLNGTTRWAAYELSEDAFDEFARFLQFCRDRDIRLEVFVAPMHATLLEGLKRRGHWGTFKAWKRRIAEMTAYWDFSGYNAITTEPVAWRMQWYWDASHYRSTVGDMMLDRMFGLPHRTGPKQFGTRVTPETIEPHFARFDPERISWLQRHPADVALVERIQRD